MDRGQSRVENVKERLETDEPVAPKSRNDFYALNRGTPVSATSPDKTPATPPGDTD